MSLRKEQLYIHDPFIIIDKDDAPKLLEACNNITPKIRFTIESEFNK